MKLGLLITIVFLSSSFTNAAEEAVDWSICKADLESTRCNTRKRDHDKHKCLEKASEGKVSKECEQFNQTLESKFSKHNHKRSKD